MNKAKRLIEAVASGADPQSMLHEAFKTGEPTETPPATVKQIDKALDSLRAANKALDQADAYADIPPEVLRVVRDTRSRIRALITTLVKAVG